MPIPKKGEPGYDEYREKYNARRRARRADPEYLAKEREAVNRRRRGRRAREREAKRREQQG
ncbi:hypothetical protein L828_3198 [Mycobacteroides abscessus MAB_030201_1061]|uniref:hypothetical protein n=1 Tax=Mycobacteroides abscessus TaxID=36809 RepID=UPI00044518E7|nr:hypothetical protein [Mycobacteroides abscessus]ETZ93309.1 hypothetical protein L828_3198 [Mycobacteroides abscessus MAB_030201_1061]